MPVENLAELSVHEREPLQDHCGIVAAYSKTPFRFFMTGVAGTEKMQTRGTTGVGQCSVSENGCIQVFKARGQVSEGFSSEVVAQNRNLHASSWLFEVRYATNGDEESLENIQPVIREHKNLGVFAVVHNGQFSDQAVERVNGESDTVIFAEQLAEREANTWENLLLGLTDEKRGAASVAIATRDGIYLWRDEWGVRPLSYGKKIDQETGEVIWITASETAALEAMGVMDFKEVMPGSVIKLAELGPEILREPSTQEQHAACIFENVYIQNGGSAMHRSRESEFDINYERSVGEFRTRSGVILAQEEVSDLAQRVDFACGIPGTGIAGGRAFATELGIPYIQAISDRKPQGQDMRTFMIDKIEKIPTAVEEHFFITGNYLKGMSIVLIDDSIVRGNITKGLVKTLREVYEVKEVHIRVLCPPIDKPCYLGINTRTHMELIAHRQAGDIDAIREEIGANSLRFLSDRGLLEATGQENGFCLGCMVGHTPPIDRKGNIIYLNQA